MPNKRNRPKVSATVAEALANVKGPVKIKRRGPTPLEKRARNLRINHGMEPPPKKRPRKPKESKFDPSIKDMPSMFDVLLAEPKDRLKKVT